ncbi:Uma2 family endonuclease [Gloeocapsopsis crepidinum LEGE 06123]|uniref:Uma2 family endonuclease n=1 Tax=Gloeocapsopsis crepidinum LEGE 06123 TaxID=588587 RepID=A0ABR9UVX9_9CHRO|nr:Uma2 family endonuclease [Gloeocapsopsis crepidinum]MBE9192449.1 Uma2 family endonuclease [Gloeocapsopsis crepidinum LEGE 06123]
MQLQLNQLDVKPGQRVLLRNISWNEFEQIVDELGSRASRLAYYKGMLEIMIPLAEDEDGKILISNLVEILLEELDIEFRNLGSTTFKRRDMASGVEPDACFYIQHEAAIRGKSKIDANVDPPPDLAIEIDITSASEIKKSSYEALGVPELWIYDGRSLQIYVLQQQYVATQQSQIFPNLPIVEFIPQYIAHSKVQGRNAAIKAFRTWVQHL